MKKISLFLITLFLIGCASTKEKASDNLKKGNYLKAFELFVKAVKEDPSDAEAQAGKRKAGKALMNEKLVELKRGIDAGQVETSLMRAKWIYDFQQKHGANNFANMAGYQKSQLKRLYPLFRKDISSTTSLERPLRSMLYYKEYSVLFKKINPRELGTIQKKINNAGQKRCKTLSLNSKGFDFYRGFVNSYCSYFGKSLNLSTNLKNELYKTQSVSIDVKGLKSGLHPVLKEELQKALADSPMYDPKGKNKLPIKIAGTYDHNKVNYMENKMHNYRERVAYQETETVEKSRFVLLGDASICRLRKTDPNCIIKNNKSYRKETYLEEDAVVKYRYEDKAFPYQVMTHKRTMNLSLNGEFQFKDKNYYFTMEKNLDESDFEHSMNIEKIGLKPKKNKLRSENKMARSVFNAYAKSYFEKTKEAWINEFCKDTDGSGNIATSGNGILKCMRAKPISFEPVKNWFYTNFNLKIKHPIESRFIKELGLKTL
jgi:hypothetical protein